MSKLICYVYESFKVLINVQSIASTRSDRPKLKTTPTTSPNREHLFLFSPYLKAGACTLWGVAKQPLTYTPQPTPRFGQTEGVFYSSYFGVISGNSNQ
ncbi:hypothetical protein [Nostoc sp. FACHB-110]|uniref:hypothetical protein n=1 Tax=Nostoc sp. FACHB-110 TaxID=2692834 RepID=UPI0016859E7C|nr:hypothetical protein [Nostoc sp. FACHB-110]MBD2438974.1 hypothetical protein [Nostoc sp. FACHB-110]